MKHKDVIAKVLNYHPTIPNYSGCDDFKFGDPDAECTGVACAMVATVEVIREAARLGCNLLIVHEPTFYQTPDFPEWRGGFGNAVYEEKCRLLSELGMTIWRDHDHMHVHKPDRIFTGVIKYLGWEDYVVNPEGSPDLIYKFKLPRTTVGELEQTLLAKLNLNGMRLIGNRADTIQTVAIVGHLFPEAHGGSRMNEDGTFHEYASAVMRALEDDVDAIIPGEVVEWTVLSYIRDAVQFGMPKAMFNIGHFSMEELGMRYAADWLADVVEHQVPVRYLSSGDLFDYSS